MKPTKVRRTGTWTHKKERIQARSELRVRERSVYLRMPQRSVSVGETLSLGGQDKEKDFVLVSSTVQATHKMRFRGYGSIESGEDYSTSSHNTQNKSYLSLSSLTRHGLRLGPTHGMKVISQRSISEIIAQDLQPTEST